MEKTEGKTTRIVQSYSEAFKRMVVEDYFRGDCSQRGIMRKYEIKSCSLFLKWLKIFRPADLPVLDVRSAKFENITYSCMTSKPSSDSSQDPQVLQNRIAELERQLQDEKLRSEAYQRMIEKAEKDLNISIKKKPFTK